MAARPSREAVMAALFASFQAAPSLSGVIEMWGRRVIPWHKVQVQPALFLVGTNDENQWQGQNRVLTMGAKVWLYSRVGQDPTAASDTGVHDLLDALDAAMLPDDPMQQRYTIGGTVFWCRQNGHVETYTGDLDGQSLSIAHIDIIVP